MLKSIKNTATINTRSFSLCPKQYTKVNKTI